MGKEGGRISAAIRQELHGWQMKRVALLHELPKFCRANKKKVTYIKVHILNLSLFRLDFSSDVA